MTTPTNPQLAGGPGAALQPSIPSIPRRVLLGIVLVLVGALAGAGLVRLLDTESVSEAPATAVVESPAVAERSPGSADALEFQAAERRAAAQAGCRTFGSPDAIERCLVDVSR